MNFFQDQSILTSGMEILLQRKVKRSFFLSLTLNNHL